MKKMHVGLKEPAGGAAAPVAVIMQKQDIKERFVSNTHSE